MALFFSMSIQEQSGTVVVDGGACRYSNLTAGTALLKTGAGKLDGVVINSHSSGTLLIHDGLTAAGSLIHGTITLASGERAIDFGGVIFNTGLFVTVGGTCNCTIRFR